MTFSGIIWLQLTFQDSQVEKSVKDFWVQRMYKKEDLGKKARKSKDTKKLVMDGVRKSEYWLVVCYRPSCREDKPFSPGLASCVACNNTPTRRERGRARVEDGKRVGKDPSLVHNTAAWLLWKLTCPTLRSFWAPTLGSPGLQLTMSLSLDVGPLNRFLGGRLT